MLASLFWMVTLLMAPVTDVANPLASKAISDRPVYQISLDRDGNRLWVYRRYSGVERMNLTTGDVDRSLPIEEMELAQVAHSRDGSTSLLCGMDGTLLLYRDGEETRLARIIQQNEMIVGASVSQDGAVAVCMTSRGQVHGWRRDGSEVREFAYDLPLESALLSIHLSSNGRQLFVAQHAGTVSSHCPETGIPDGIAIRIGEACVTHAWSADDRLMGAVTSTGKMAVYELPTGRIAFERLLDDCRGAYDGNPVMVISPDGRNIAVTADFFRVIRIWDMKTGQPPRELLGHDGMVRTLQFAPSADRLFSGSYDGTIREWSLETYSQLRVVN